MKLKLTSALVLFALMVLSPIDLASQEEETGNQNKRNMFGVGFSYAVVLPAADFEDRFGLSFSIGADAEFITAKQSFILGFQTRYLYGSNVKEDVLENLRTDGGYILSVAERPGNIAYKMRGFYSGITIGKIISFRDNSKSGLRVSLGAGMLAHRIKINDLDGTIPQVYQPYNKGYDRKTVGLALTEFIGYQHMDRFNRLNVFGGLEFTQGFGKNVRPINFDTLMKDDSKRTDITIGLRVGFILSLYTNGNTSGDDLIWY